MVGIDAAPVRTNSPVEAGEVLVMAEVADVEAFRHGPDVMLIGLNMCWRVLVSATVTTWIDEAGPRPTVVSVRNDLRKILLKRVVALDHVIEGSAPTALIIARLAQSSGPTRADRVLAAIETGASIVLQRRDSCCDQVFWRPVER